MSMKNQRILAVVLAHAVLHCSNGPWLCENWSKEHVCFFRNDPSWEPDTSRPFLKIQFEDSSVDPQDSGYSESLFSLHSNPALLSLGILLLEIYLNGPIEESWTEGDLNEGQPNGNTNLTAALRILDDRQEDIYERYRAAIRACLEWDLQGLDRDNLPQKIYDEIVEPLEQELLHGFKITPEDLDLLPLNHP
jgi:hypothetical protein